MKKLFVVVACLLTGACMTAAEQVQADVEACKSVKLPQQQCLAAIQQERAQRRAEEVAAANIYAATAAASQPVYRPLHCSTIAGITNCY